MALGGRLLLWTLAVVSAAGIAVASPSRSSYQYAIKIENAHAPLLHLASYAIGPGGFFKIALDVTLTIDTPGADRGRNMLHLTVCDSDALTRFSHLPASGNGSRVSDRAPAFCAMANQTLSDLCRSYPLFDESKNDYVYRSQKTLEVAWTVDDQTTTTTTTTTAASSTMTSDGTLHFFIDACETVGGAEGVLRSCLAQEDSLAPGSRDCFYCPKNYPTVESTDCRIPPRIQPRMLVQASMNLCNKDGTCLSQDAEFLATTYLGLTIAWAVVWLLWAAHIRATREAMVALQTRMKLVPTVLCVYAGLTCAMLYTDQVLDGTARKLVVNGAILSQVFALAVPAEVIILIAKGWKITRAQLDAREHQYIRFVTIVWAISFTVLKHSVVKHLTVFLVWGVSWSSVVFMIWYNSAFNLNMLRYQIAMVRQLQLDPTRTPVVTKYKLFRHFRGLLAVYMFISCVIAVLGLVSDATNDRWRSSATAADETLSFALYVMIGYAFRCRRFSNLIQAPMSATGEADANASISQGPTTASVALSASVAPTAPTAPRLLGDVPRTKSAMVLVVNPDPQEQSLGTSYVPVNPKPPKMIKKHGSSNSAGGPRSSFSKKDSTSQ
jgi:hypothetical protein